MQQSPLDPVKALKNYGLPTRTIARIARVGVFAIRSRDWEEVPESDPVLIPLSNAVSLLGALQNSATLKVDPATFYEEQFVRMTKHGELFYCPAYQLYESGLWTQEDFIDYANQTTFYSRQDFGKEFPLVTEVVDAPDGYKAIVCRHSVPHLDLKTVSSLAGFAVIK